MTDRYIDEAVDSFRTLLTEQLARVEKMENGGAAKNFGSMPVRTSQPSSVMRIVSSILMPSS